MKLLKPLLGVAVALGFLAPTAMACHSRGSISGNSAQTPYRHHGTRTAEGTVTGLNGNQLSISHGNNKNRQNLTTTVGGNTRIIVPVRRTVTDSKGHTHVVTTEQPGSLSDLQDNQNVVVTYDDTDGAALSIQILPHA